MRGTSPELSSVTINGNRIPSAVGDVRNVQLDLIPADMIQTIEVNKVVTADMDGDAIGGSINLVTKNSPYKRTLSATAGVFYKRITDCMVSRVAYSSYQTYADCKITRPLNVFDADLWGIELGLQRDFGLVAPALKCLGFYGNYTYTHSRVARSHVEGNEGGTLPGSPEQMANASLCFEKAGFSVRLSYNYTADFQDD